MADHVGADLVVFDFGGVFTTSPFAMIASASDVAGVEPSDAVRLVFGPYHEDTDHPWHRLERGEISFMEAREEIMARSESEVGVAVDPIQLFAAFSSDAGLRPDVVDVGLEIRATGRTVSCLTNNLAEFRDRWKSLLPVDDLFHDIVDSSEVGLRKPDPEIYHLTQVRAGVEDPGRVVFLDDAPGNIEAARAVGWQAILVDHDHEPAVAELRGWLRLA